MVRGVYLPYTLSGPTTKFFFLCVYSLSYCHLTPWSSNGICSLYTCYNGLLKVYVYMYPCCQWSAWSLNWNPASFSYCHLTSWSSKDIFVYLLSIVCWPLMHTCCHAYLLSMVCLKLELVPCFLVLVVFVLLIIWIYQMVIYIFKKFFGKNVLCIK